jgi:hypothetical protein
MTAAEQEKDGGPASEGLDVGQTGDCGRVVEQISYANRT